mmetsp:Transcript_112101/g.215932  ORF Transcript_112101/g.215932 Transcript_112101/m.215932 type:complete len:365 (+) Transcript_112101:101-1195(+)
MSVEIDIGACFAPWGVANAPMITCNDSKAIIPHDDECVTVCNEGYSPIPEILECRNTRLFPPTFACEPLNCTAPVGILYALPVPCVEGMTIGHGQMCTPQCYPMFCCSGWCDIICRLGQLEPAGWDCIWCYLTTTTSTTTTSGMPCPVANLSQNVTKAHPTNPCKNAVIHVLWMDNCTPRCDIGYKADLDAIFCLGSLGHFTPPTWECLPALSCTPPEGEIENAPNNVAKRCYEGGAIESQLECSTRCNVNYKGVPEKLYCEDGVLDPPDFECEMVVYIPPEAPPTTSLEPDATLSAVVGMGIGGIIGALSALGAVALVFHVCTKRRLKGGKKPAKKKVVKLKTSKHQYSSFTGAGRRRGRGRV